MNGYFALVGILRLTTHPVVQCICLIIMGMLIKDGIQFLYFKYSELSQDPSLKSIGCISVLAGLLSSSEERVQVYSSYVLAFYCREGIIIIMI